MSATETPKTDASPVEEAAPPPVERDCPRCGAHLRDDQEWCLQCGTGVGAHVAPPRGWRVPVAVVGSILALVAIAVILAIVELASDAEQVTTAPPAAATPAPTVVPTTTPAPTATATPTPTATAPSSGGTSATTEWPPGKTGFTIVLESDSTRSAAQARAKELVGQGMAVGVLDSTGYRRVTPNRFVVFSGVYASRAEAQKALAGIRSRVAGAQVKRVAPA